MTRILLLLISLLTAITTMAASNKFVLVIDAGHGGHDAGAIGAVSKEKDINLNTALAFGRLVEQNCSDVKVIYTRKTDVFIPLNQRASIANKNHADVFISIHTNALPAGRIARGIETYTMGMRRSDEKLSAAQRENSVITYEKGYQETYAGYDPNSPESAIMFEFINDKNMAESVELAKLVQKDLCSATNRANKGVKQDVFLVLRETSMPACLIELGFISTPDEETLLNNKDHINKMAQGIYNAFVKYKNKKIGAKGEVAQLATPSSEQEAITAKSTTAEEPNTKSSISTESGAKGSNAKSSNAKEANSKSTADKQQEEQIKESASSAKPATQQKKRLTYHVRRPEPETVGGVSTPATPAISQSAIQKSRNDNNPSVSVPQEVGKTYVVYYNKPDDPQPANNGIQQPHKPVNSNAKVSEEPKVVVAAPVDTPKVVVTAPAETPKDVVTAPVDTPKVVIAAPVDTPKVVIAAPVDTIKAEKPIAVDTIKAVDSIIADTAKAEKPSVADTVTMKTDSIVFKVQLMSGRTILKDGDSRFQGLTDTSYYIENDVYKYTVGSCATQAEAAELKKKIADKFPDAFVVAFLNGQRISVSEAVQLLKKKQ